MNEITCRGIRFRDEDDAYEYFRQREIDEMDFPSEETLIARGKYATLSAERRDLLRELRQDAEAIADNARRIIKAAEDVDFAQDEAMKAASRIGIAQTRIHRLGELAALRDELRLAAWGTTKETE